jgi:hypothetical protein
MTPDAVRDSMKIVWAAKFTSQHKWWGNTRQQGWRHVTCVYKHASYSLNLAVTSPSLQTYSALQHRFAIQFVQVRTWVYVAHTISSGPYICNYTHVLRIYSSTCWRRHALPLIFDPHRLKSYGYTSQSVRPCYMQPAMKQEQQWERYCWTVTVV